MTTPPPPPTPAGWYPDPSGVQGQRYFDGKEWTEHRAIAGTPPLTSAAKNKASGVLLGIGIAGLLLFGGCTALLVATGSDEKPSSSNSSSTAAPKAPAIPPEPMISTPTLAPAGSSVRDGKFEFQVLDVSSAKTIGDNQFLQTTAQGVFVVFTLRVTNIGNEPQNFFAQNQRLIDTSGRQYEASTEADMNLNDIAGLGQINPGNSVEVKVAFDVPADLMMAALELHDSAFSGGVRTDPAAAG